MNIFDIPNGTDPIDVRKKLNKMLSDAKKEAKPAKCILCGKTQTSFCNSHSVPQLALRPIADNGLVLHASAVMGFNEEIVDIEDGVNRSGTFNCICRSCDGSFFQDYENESNLINPPTDKMMAEIAVKNMLLLINKRMIEKPLTTNLANSNPLFENVETLLDIKDLDVKEFKQELFFHKEIIDQQQTGCYQILFWKVLPYIIPIATQSAIALQVDMYGKPVNNLYNYDPNIRMQYMHLCFFPLNNQSLVLAFYHKRDRLYRNLRHEINSSSESNVLKYLNYLMFAHTENYFISKSIKSEFENNLVLQNLSQESNGLPMFGFLNKNNNFGTGYNPVTMDQIPNFLESQWAVVKNANNS